MWPCSSGVADVHGDIVCSCVFLCICRYFLIVYGWSVSVLVVITGALLQLCHYWCLVTVMSLLVPCYSYVITGALLQLCHYWCLVTVMSLLVHCYSCVYLFLCTISIVLSIYKLLKGALYGIESSTRNGNIWPTHEEAAPSVPKNILLPFESNTDTRLSFPIYYRCFHNCTVQGHF